MILAGGLGTRLYPLTRITNKHLLPVYKKPMIYYPLETLVKAGIKDLLIVTGGNNAGDFLRLLGDGREFGLKHINYACQQGEGGIADALRLAEHFTAGQKIVVFLGDNIIGGSIEPYVRSFARQKQGAKILLKEVPDPEKYGVPGFRKGRISGIIEKPGKPASRYAVTGIYFYSADVFEIIHSLKPSKRGELEITDVNNVYIKRGTMTHEILECWWADAGASLEAFYNTGKMIEELGANT